MTEQPDPAADRVCGVCRECRDYGLGTYDGQLTGIYDWITEHIGCRLPRPANAE
ncbi:hypothetical protein GCM10018790_75330 [Kitasatospora xanthocidica]|uniref:hypothetical protein n=1 Tax=Kitasatospora xanthocidica TaxID=83382 RepID=UPI00167C0F27|nr:hypothetical protein [Kitasatospora xanthocidica]GHF86779.1 hypothetical protein GCM10018790_75330 [Kitasatospora xanthocidica]